MAAGKRSFEKVLGACRSAFWDCSSDKPVRLPVVLPQAETCRGLRRFSTTSLGSMNESTPISCWGFLCSAAPSCQSSCSAESQGGGIDECCPLVGLGGLLGGVVRVSYADLGQKSNQNAARTGALI